MEIQTIRIVARITAQPGQEQTLYQLLSTLLAPTRAEEGCLSYQLYQGKDNPAEFVFLEEWSDQVAIDRHLQSAHVAEVIAQCPPLLAKAPEIINYHRIG